VLGGVDAVTAEGCVIGVPSAAQRRLLGVLAIHAPRRLRGERLADVLGIGAGALRTTVARGRATLGPGAGVTAITGESIACEVDASRFCRAVADAHGARATPEALEGALALWSGPPLEEFGEEEWARGEVLRLTELHAGAVDDYAETLIAAHRPVDAVVLLESHIDRQPYRDRPRGLLIQALALAGRQADALRAFQAYRAMLAEEVGTEPSPEVVRIERRVASGWNGVEHEHGTPAPPDALEIPLPAALARRVGLIGRTAERDVLHAELALASAGGLRAVVVGGEAGIGKTTLLAEFASSVFSSGEATVLYGRCDETAAVLEPFRRCSARVSSMPRSPSSRITWRAAAASSHDSARSCRPASRRHRSRPGPTTSRHGSWRSTRRLTCCGGSRRSVRS
jgi:DNA-binding SARP family transcriptional activator